MQNNMIYLDYVSSTPLDKELQDTYLGLLQKYYANSDSIHDLGREVSTLVEKSRRQIADFLGVKAPEIIFTSGASEANNTAIKGVGLALKNKGKHIITTAYEHNSTLKSAEQMRDVFGFDVTFLKPDASGQVTLDMVKKALRDDTVLVSVMYVNNEVGCVNPVEEIGEYVKKHSQAYFHVDCVQALGKYPIHTENFDLCTLSMHKVFGLKGSGILMKKQNVPLVPLISGGQQEFGLRGGTLNACTDILCAKTVRKAMQSQKEHYQMVSELKDYIWKQLEEIEGIVMNSPVNGSPFIVNFSYPKIKSEVMMNALNMKGFALSAQSTCDSRSKSLSHVYVAMGFSEERALSAVRIGLSHLVTKEQIDAFIETLKGIIENYG